MFYSFVFLLASCIVSFYLAEATSFTLNCHSYKEVYFNERSVNWVSIYVLQLLKYS